MHTVALKESPALLKHLKTYPAVQYGLVNPVIHNTADLNSGIKDLVLGEHQKMQASCPPVHVSQLSDIMVNPNGSLIDSAGNALHESVHDFAKSMTAETTTSQSSLNQTGIVLFKYGFRNYGHWLIEMLPKLYFLKPFLDQYPHAKILIGDLNQGLSRVVHSTLASFGIPEHAILPIKESTQVKDIIYCSPITKHPFLMRPEIYTFYNNMPNNSTDGNRKIFVTRPASGNRVISNVAEVESYFATRGYEIIEPGKLSFDEQVATFRSSTDVVGIAGAAMTNTVFCRKHTKIMHIVPPSMPNLFFYQLASICSHSYSEFRGKSDSGMFSKSFDIDFNDLCKYIEHSDAIISN